MKSRRPDTQHHEPTTLHRARWLSPVAAPTVEDGAVLVSGAHIVSAGPYRRVKTESPPNTTQVDHGGVVLFPGVVNAHTHLELSALRGRISLPKQGYPEWLHEMLQVREDLTPDKRDEGFQAGLRELADWGTALCGDITNGACLQTDSGRSMTARQVFLEVLGFNRNSLESALGEGVLGNAVVDTAYDFPLSMAAHGCYSTSAAVIQGAKQWCRREGKVFSIHVAEHVEEVEFLRDGRGYCRALLEALGKWAPCWAHPGVTPVGYLEKLGVLDERTLLVHAVHMEDSDWELVARKSSPVCFCPRSNSNLGVGKADIPKAIRNGIRTCLGTDSLAGNRDLNLFAEAAWVLTEHPSLSPQDVLSMLTIEGARALGRDREFGSIEPGKRSAFLAVSVPDSVTASDLAEAIIHEGNQGAIQWVNHPAKACD